MLKLVEECSGVGELSGQGELPRRVRYTINRYQGLVEGSGLPIPGWHRVEGSLDFAPTDDVAGLVGAHLTLKLEDGRAIGVTVADSNGRVLTEGHGPFGCSCC